MRIGIRIVVFAFILAGCASMPPIAPVITDTLLVTGDLLESAGESFTKTADAYKLGCDGVPRTITPTQCGRFKAFEHTFKPAYAKAITGWRAARVAGDVVTQNSAAATITTLATQALPFAVSILGGVK